MQQNPIQSNPIKSNPWVNPNHDYVWRVAFFLWHVWLLCGLVILRGLSCQRACMWQPMVWVQWTRPVL